MPVTAATWHAMFKTGDSQKLGINPGLYLQGRRGRVKYPHLINDRDSMPQMWHFFPADLLQGIGPYTVTV
jgi:hypothetical protein